jgi:hypothetical protein
MYPKSDVQKHALHKKVLAVLTRSCIILRSTGRHASTRHQQSDMLLSCIHTLMRASSFPVRFPHEYRHLSQYMPNRPVCYLSSLTMLHATIAAQSLAACHTWCSSSCGPNMHAVVCHDQPCRPCRPSLDLQACAHMFPYYCHCVHAESAVTIAPSHVLAPHPVQSVPIFPCLGSSCPTPMHDLHVSCMASTSACMLALCQVAVPHHIRLPR